MTTTLRFQFVRAAALAAVFFGGAQINALATVIFDQGPLTGSIGGGWQNQTALQNFADNVTFASNTTVGGLNYFTDFNLSANTGSSDFHLKILADAGGTPGGLLFSDDIGYSSSYTEGGFNAYHFDFTSQLFLAGTQYWIGISGNGFEAALLSVNGSPSGDGKMAQFFGSTFSFIQGSIGDHMFQLTGESTPTVPDTASTSLLVGMGLVTMVGLSRRLGRRA